MKNSTNQKSKIQGIEDLSFDQILIVNLELDRQDRITKRIVGIAIGIIIAILSFGISFGYFGTF